MTSSRTVGLRPAGRLRARRSLGIAAPSGAAVFQRVVQLVLLAAIGHLSSGADRAGLISSFGIISAFAVLTDSGAANYVLSRPRAMVHRETLRRVLGVHVSISVCGGAAALAYCWFAFGGTVAGTFGIILTLALTQVVESAVRVCRTPLLLYSQDLTYAGTDFAMAVGKLCVLGIAFATGQLAWLALLPLAPACVLIATWQRSFRLLIPALDDRRVRIREIIRFGIAGASSALYSQSALIISGVMLPVELVAMLTVILRIIQPAEIVPATLSQQAIPRLKSGRVRLAALTAGFAAIGAVVAVLIWICWPVLENLLGYRITTLAPLAVLLVSVPIKFANYALTAGLYSADRAGLKTVISVSVGLVVVALIAFASSSDTLLFVAGASSAGEAILFLALAAGVIGSSRKIAQS